jgi:DNA-binding response OmpR family regulator
MENDKDLKRRILVVDDDRSLVHIVEEVLRYEGYTVLTAFDGLEALRRVRLEPPDLIIMDLVMPKMNGYEVCRVLQASPATAGIPILMLTGQGQVDPPAKPGGKWSLEKGIQERIEGFESGALEFLSKPVGASELVAHVRKVLALADLGR